MTTYTISTGETNVTFLFKLQCQIKICTEKIC